MPVQAARFGLVALDLVSPAEACAVGTCCRVISIGTDDRGWHVLVQGMGRFCCKKQRSARAYRSMMTEVTMLNDDLPPQLLQHSWTRQMHIRHPKFVYNLFDP